MTEPTKPNVSLDWWRRLRLAASAAVATAIVYNAMVTATTPRQWEPAALAIFEAALVPAIPCGVLAIALVRFGDRIRALIAKIPRVVIDIAFFSISMFVTLRMTYSAFGGWPQIQDEISYDLLARRIANLTPVPASHPLPEFFRMRFLVDDGRSYPLFQPGWPLLLAFFHTIGKPALAPAFSVAVLTVATSRLGERLYGRITSILAGALVLSSGFVNVVGCAYFAHAWAAALFVLGVERLFASLSEEDPIRAKRAAVAAGLWGAWLVVTRLPTAAAFVVTALVVIGCGSFERLRPRPKLLERARRPLVAFALAFSLGPLAQAGWNFATTRNPLQLPQDKYFAQTEPVPHCHRLGFGEGVGCPREHPHDALPGGFTLGRAVVVSTMRWSVFRTDAWGTAWPLAIAALFFARRLRGRDAVVATATLTPVAVYFAFYYHAIQHGARLWADLMGPLSVLIAAGACAVFDDASKPGAQPDGSSEPFWLQRWAGACGVALLVLVIHDEHTRDLPDRVEKLSRIRQAERVRSNLDAADVRDAVVYIGNCIDPNRGDVVYGWASVLNATPPERGSRYIVRDFGPEHDRQMVTLMPNRKHVRADCNGKVVPFDDPTPSPALIVTEMEAKFPPDERDGCYASIRGVQFASNKQVLDIRASQPGAFARFRQHVFEAGDYEVRAVVALRRDGGRFAIVIDGKQLETPMESRGDRGLALVTNKALALTPGTHQIELRSLEGEGVFVLSIDRIELRKL